MIGSWQPPRIERIASLESRRLAALPVAGLSGDLHQDLGRGAIAVEIAGSLVGDEARDDFLKELREKFLDGSPVDFVADIVKESKLEQVLIEALEFEESSAVPEVFRYRIVLREYTEPPAPPAADLGAELDAELDLEAELGLDMLDLPAITADVPQVGDLLAPVQTAADSLKESLSGAAGMLTDLSNLFE